MSGGARVWWGLVKCLLCHHWRCGVRSNCEIDLSPSLSWPSPRQSPRYCTLRPATLVAKAGEAACQCLQRARTWRPPCFRAGEPRRQASRSRYAQVETRCTRRGALDFDSWFAASSLWRCESCLSAVVRRSGAMVREGLTGNRQALWGGGEAFSSLDQSIATVTL